MDQAITDTTASCLAIALTTSVILLPEIAQLVAPQDGLESTAKSLVQTELMGQIATKPADFVPVDQQYVIALQVFARKQKLTTQSC